MMTRPATTGGTRGGLHAAHPLHRGRPGPHPAGVRSGSALGDRPESAPVADPAGAQRTRGVVPDDPHAAGGPGARGALTERPAPALPENGVLSGLPHPLGRHSGPHGRARGHGGHPRRTGAPGGGALRVGRGAVVGTTARGARNASGRGGGPAAVPRGRRGALPGTGAGPGGGGPVGPGPGAAGRRSGWTARRAGAAHALGGTGAPCAVSGGRARPQARRARADPRAVVLLLGLPDRAGRLGAAARTCLSRTARGTADRPRPAARRTARPDPGTASAGHRSGLDDRRTGPAGRGVGAHREPAHHRPAGRGAHQQPPVRHERAAHAHPARGGTAARGGEPAASVPGGEQPYPSPESRCVGANIRSTAGSTTTEGPGAANAFARSVSRFSGVVRTPGTPNDSASAT